MEKKLEKQIEVEKLEFQQCKIEGSSVERE